MGRPATPFRNEFKTRVEDPIAEIILDRAAETGLSEARIIRDLLAIACLGVFYKIPIEDARVRHEMAISGQKTTTTKIGANSCL